MKNNGQEDPKMQPHGSRYITSENRVVFTTKCPQKLFKQVVLGKARVQHIEE